MWNVQTTETSRSFLFRNEKLHLFLLTDRHRNSFVFFSYVAPFDFSFKYEKEQIKILTQENIQLKKQLKTVSAIWQNKNDSLIQELIVLNRTIENKSDIPGDAKNSPSDVVELKPEKFLSTKIFSDLRYFKDPKRT